MANPDLAPGKEIPDEYWTVDCPKCGDFIGLHRDHYDDDPEVTECHPWQFIIAWIRHTRSAFFNW